MFIIILINGGNNNFLERKNEMRKNENGRSMIEMLGVLAIIGVLSVGGIYGYTVAMRKYKANEIVQTASMLATLAQSANAGLGGEVKLGDSGLNDNPGGVTLDTDATKAAAPAVMASGASVKASAVTIKLGTADTDLCDAVKAIAPSKPTSGHDTSPAARAGYYIDTCS